MTELFSTILLRVTLAGAASAVALRIAGGGTMREVVKLAAGLLMLLALLQPLRGADRYNWTSEIGAAQTDIDAIEQQNIQTTMSTLASTIADTAEQRAAAEGFDCSVHVEMAKGADGLLQIGRLTVYYSARDAERLPALQQLLAQECGVPADRQELIRR